MNLFQNLFQLKQDQKEALDKAEAALGAPDHVMTASEREQYERQMATFESLGVSIQAREKVNTIRSVFAGGIPGITGPVAARPGVAAPRVAPERHKLPCLPNTRSPLLVS